MTKRSSVVAHTRTLSENSGIVKYSSRMARRCYANTIFDRLQ
jgi:hypothetical protein